MLSTSNKTFYYYKSNKTFYYYHFLLHELIMSPFEEEGGYIALHLLVGMSVRLSVCRETLSGQ